MGYLDAEVKSKVEIKHSFINLPFIKDEDFNISYTNALIKYV
jgi:hypothetical protein